MKLVNSNSPFSHGFNYSEGQVQGEKIFLFILSLAKQNEFLDLIFFYTGHSLNARK